MSFLTIIGAFVFVISAPQMLPAFRRRAAARGMSGDIIVPALLTLTGGALFILSFVLKPHL